MFKKIIMTFIALGFIFSASFLPRAEAATSYGSWEYVSKQYVGVEKHAPKLVYTSGIANRAGETASRAYSAEYTNSISASVSASLAKVISGEVGYSFGVTKGSSIQLTSAGLKKGEYAKIYETESFQVTKIIIQRKVITKNACKLEKKTLYTYKEQEPKITFKYCHKDKKGNEVCY